MCPAVNFTVDDIPRSRSPLPIDQVYNFEVKSAEVKRSDKGPYANLLCTVVDHPEFQNYNIYEILALPDETLFQAYKTHPVEAERKRMADAIGQRCFRYRQFILATGKDSAQFLCDDGQPARWDVSGMAGLRFQAKVKTETFRDEDRSKIDLYLPIVK